MIRLTAFQPMFLLFCVAGSSACSKSRSDYANSEEAAAMRYREALAARPRPSADAVLAALDAGTLKVDLPEPPADPESELECPATTNWTSLEGGPASCGYSWTIEKSQLPISPTWRPCQSMEAMARGTCRELVRHHRLKSIHAGIDAGKKIHIGFVENCATDQVVLTDGEGTAHFALRRNAGTSADTTCQIKLLALDFGQWLAALGGHDPITDSSTPGYTVGGAFIGGPIKSPPAILQISKTAPFHVATSQGAIGAESWTADGKRRSWNGGAVEKTPHIGWQPVNKDLFYQAKKGFYSAKSVDPVIAVSKGATIRHVVLRDKQMVWLEESAGYGPKTCALYATEVDGRDTLTTPRRVTELPCATSGFAFGCNVVVSGSDTQLSLVSLTSGTVRVLRMRGRAVAVDCEDAYIDRNGTLLRVNLGAFGVPRLQGFEPGHAK